MSTLMNGAKMLLECLAREGVDCFFGYPGGVTLPFYDAIYDHHIRHVLVRHEENACFAAEGYARATGKVGVCCATSGPGATNLVTGLVDAMMDSIPIVALTGQVTSKLIGSDAFQEADTFGITRSCTKHNYLVKKLEDLPQVVHEAFYIAASGRPGPVLVDIPKDVFQAQGHYTPVTSIHLPGYKVFTEGHTGQIRRAAQLMWEAERPFVYAGGGIVAANASAELRELVELLDVPAVLTLMGLGALPSNHPNFVSMPGMHGGYAANMGMTHCDVLIALGVRFDDRVTGRLAAFAPHAKVIHVDIDPAEIGKNRAADVPIVGDVKRVLGRINTVLAETRPERKDRLAAARTVLVVPDPRLEGRASPRPGHLRFRNQAAAPDDGNRPPLRRRGHRVLRRRPAPDVGRAVDPLQRSPPVDQFRRPRRHGLRPPLGHRRAVRPSRQAGLRPGGRWRIPDVHPGTLHYRQRTACPSRSWS